MGAAYYEDLAGRLYGLLIMLEDRLGGEQSQLLYHFIEVGEYRLALKDIAGALAQDKTAVTGQEPGDTLALARRMKTDGLVLNALGLCPQADRIRVGLPLAHRRYSAGSAAARRSRLVAGVAALPWTVVGWRGTTRYRWGVPRCEVELDAGGGDAFLLAGQQGQHAGIGRGGAVRVQGAWP